MSFRPTKAPGPDGVTYRALKHAPKKFVMHITNICNAMLRLRHFPSQWKLADVAMIARTVPQLAAELPAHQSSSVMSKIADQIILERPRRYPRLPIRFSQRAQHHSPTAAPRRTHKRGLQPTGMHRSGITRRRQSLRQGLAPGPTTADAPSRHLQGNGQTHSLLSPQEDLPGQAGRTAVHHEDGHSKRGARVSDLTPAV
ncbi:hypothetical protein Trydic_g16391 [Trypoxylus dichotomus]